MIRQLDALTGRTVVARRTRAIIISLALTIACVAFSQPTRAATNNWVSSGGFATWFQDSNWSVAIPTATDEAFITNGTTATIQGVTAATASNLFINSGNVTIGVIDPGTLNVTDAIAIGTTGSSGTLTLNYGTVSLNTLSVGPTGTYTDTALGTLNLTGINPTIKMAGGVTVTVNSQITGTDGLTKAGPGTLVLAGTNTYSGGTTVSVGTLQVGNGGTTGNLGSGDVTNNVSLVFKRSDTLTVDNFITGAGRLTQSGTGTLVLTGNNDYSGTTTISAGTLQIGNGGTTGSLGTGDVIDNSALAFNRGDDITVSNNVSGTGTLTQSGAGTLTLVGSNTYGGVTTINSGTLQVGNGGTTGTLGTGNVVDNGTLAFNHGDNITVSNAVSGTGGLTQAGSGTTILVGNNTYGGETLITNGTLQVGDGGTTGTLGTGAVSNDTALVFNRSNTLIVSSGINGTGTVTQAGSGTTMLTGTNTYSGMTIITNGTLQVGNGGTTGTLGSGSVSNASALVFNHSDNITVSNLVTGTGRLTQAGSGQTTIVADNTYSGGTTISTGTLAVGDGGTTGSLGTGDITNNAALAFNRGDAITISNVVSGTGSLTQAGGGTLTLTGSNTYSGATTITNGTLQIGNGGTTGTLGTGAVSNDTSLVFNHSDTLTVANVISGTGTVTQAGSGTLTLTGNNTYSGTTLITNGIVQVGDGGTTGSLGTGSVSNDTALIFNHTNDLVTVNAISGTGSVTQAGAGTLILTGTNTYSGTTTITNGTLLVGNGGATGTLGSGDVLNDSALAFNRTNALVVANAISGTGTVTQAGSGTTTLTGTNTYGGATSINNGTLQIGDGGTTGTLGTGNVTNNATLAFNRSDTVTISNVISGSGSLLQAGSGTTTLVGTNSYTGGTTITNGTLQVGNGGTTGWIGSGGVSNDATLVFNRSDGLTVSNLVTGTGVLIKDGTNTLTIIANNTYSGGTIITNGTLQVGNGGTTGALGTGAVSNASALAFNRSDNIQVDNVISGTGSLAQNGTGALTLTATNTFSGGTTVNNGGVLIIKNSNALGSGNLDLINGTLKSDPLVINVGGNYTQGTNGTLQLAIASTNNFDKLNITGTASLTGAVQIVQGGSYIPQHNNEFVIVETVGGLTGEFGSYTNLITHSPMLDPQLIYSTNDVTLKWVQESFVPFAKTANERAVARNLNLAANSSSSNAVALINFLDNLANPTNVYPLAFNLIAPEELSSMFLLSFANAEAHGNQFLNRINQLRAGSHGLTASGLHPYDPDAPEAVPGATSEWSQSVPPKHESIFSPSADNPWGVYVEGTYQTINVGGDHNAAGYAVNNKAFTVGVDRRLNYQLVVGASGGYDDSHADLTHNGHVDMQSERVQVYAAWLNQNFHVEGMTGVGFNSYNTKRFGLTNSVTGNTSGREWYGVLGTGYDWQRGPWTIGPEAVLQFTTTWINGFTEKGSMAPLHIESQSVDSCFTLFGMHANYHGRIGKVPLLLSGALSWRHEYLTDSIPIDSRFADGSGGVFTVHGPKMGADSAEFNVGLSLQWTEMFSTYLNLTTELGRGGYDMYGVNVGAGVNF